MIHKWFGKWFETGSGWFEVAVRTPPCKGSEPNRFESRTARALKDQDHG